MQISESCRSQMIQSEVCQAISRYRHMWSRSQRSKGPAMRKTLRPYMTAGVAVVGASVLAIAPVIATPPDVKIINPAVQQSAGSLEDYVETVREALENLEALLG